MNPSNAIALRYGKSTSGSVTRMPGDQGSSGRACDSNMQASCCSSASWKQMSPYSGSDGMRSSAVAIPTARDPLAFMIVAFTTSPRRR